MEDRKEETNIREWKIRIYEWKILMYGWKILMYGWKLKGNVLKVICTIKVSHNTL